MGFLPNCGWDNTIEWMHHLDAFKTLSYKETTPKCYELI